METEVAAPSVATPVDVSPQSPPPPPSTSPLLLLPPQTHPHLPPPLSPPLPPHLRTLNILRFTESPELIFLHAVIFAHASSDFLIPNSKCHGRKRQRVMGHPAEVVKKPCRRVRQRAELRANPDDGFVRSGDGLQRMRMHLWQEALLEGAATGGAAG